MGPGRLRTSPNIKRTQLRNRKTDARVNTAANPRLSNLNRKNNPKFKNENLDAVETQVNLPKGHLSVVSRGFDKEFEKGDTQNPNFDTLYDDDHDFLEYEYDSRKNSRNFGGFDDKNAKVDSFYDDDEDDFHDYDKVNDNGRNYDHVNRNIDDFGSDFDSVGSYSKQGEDQSNSYVSSHLIGDYVTQNSGRKEDEVIIGISSDRKDIIDGFDDKKIHKTSGVHQRQSTHSDHDANEDVIIDEGISSSYLKADEESIYGDDKDDRVSISDFSFSNSSQIDEDFDNADEKLIIVPSIIDINGQLKTKDNDEIEKDLKTIESDDLSHFNFEFEARNFDETTISQNVEMKEKKIVLSTTEVVQSFEDDFDIVEDVEQIKTDDLNNEQIGNDEIDDESTSYDTKNEQINLENFAKESNISQKTLVNEKFDGRFPIIEQNTEYFKEIDEEDIATTTNGGNDYVNLENVNNLLGDSQESANLYSSTIQSIQSEIIQNISKDHSLNSIKNLTQVLAQKFVLNYTQSSEQVDETSELFNALEYGVMDQIYVLVKKDVEVNLHKAIINSVNFTKMDFEILVSEIHKDSSLKLEFKEYLRALVKIESEHVVKDDFEDLSETDHNNFENYNVTEIEQNLTVRNDNVTGGVELTAIRELNATDVTTEQIKHFHVKKKELMVADLRNEFQGVYSMIFNLPHLKNTLSIDKRLNTESYTFLNDDTERELNDQGSLSSLEMALALPSRQDATDDYYDTQDKDLKSDEEIKKRNRVGADTERSTPEKAFKTFDTPSGRVKILYQVNEKDQAKKLKEIDIRNIDASIQNTRFMQESEKHKVSAVMTPDGKIGILVKAKGKTDDQIVSSDQYDDRSYPNPKMVPTNVLVSESTLKTTVLRPVSGTLEGFDADRTVLKPVGTNVWTAHRKETTESKKAKNDNLGDVPYDDDYYDEDDLTTRQTLTEDQKVLWGFKTESDNEATEKIGVDSKNSDESVSEIDSTESRDKNVIRTFDEDFLKGLQKNSTEEKRERKPDYPGGIRNPNSIDYRKNHEKSVYLNMLDILGPDSRDVIQLLKDVKHINNDRGSPGKKQSNSKDISTENDRKTSSGEGSIPIFNRTPSESDKNNHEDDRLKLDEERRILEDGVSGNRDNLRNRVDFHLNRNLNSESDNEKDWNTHRPKNIDEIWTDAEDELAEDSMVRIIPVHTGHSIFQRIGPKKGRNTDGTNPILGTIPSITDFEFTTEHFNKDRILIANNSSPRSGDSSFTYFICLGTIFGFGFYTMFSWIKLHYWFLNLIQMH